LCTKAYQAVPAIQDIQHRLDTKQRLRIFLLCNGALDVRDKLLQTTTTTTLQQQALDLEHHLDLIMCTTTHGVVNESVTTTDIDDDDDDDMFHLLHVGMGRTYMGMGASSTKSIAQLWDQAGLCAEAIPNDQMEVLLWKKLAANCICNPLTALWNVTNGNLQHNPSFAAIRQQLVQEVSDVGRALHPNLQEDLDPESLDGYVEEVIQANFNNKSSMHRDIQQKKRTEIENLNGYVVRKTAELQLGSAPANEELLRKIQDLNTDYTSQ
jgi:2-dehydropantoate 2-reductase